MQSPVGDNVTYQAASDVDSRGNFTRNGNLNSQQQSNINFTSDSFSVFAISRDLGTIQAHRILLSGRSATLQTSPSIIPIYLVLLVIRTTRYNTQMTQTWPVSMVTPAR